MTVLMRSRGILNAFRLKNIMLVLMTLDHLYQYLFSDRLLFAHYTARVVAPVFVFLMTWGMVYTHDRRRYVLRLFIAGGVMSAGNFIITAITGINIPNNIFFSLAVGAALIACIDRLREGKDIPLWLSVGVLLIVLSFYCEGQYLVPLMAVIFYYLRERRAVMCAVFVILTVAPYAAMYAIYGTLNPQFWMVFSVVPVMMYNGKRGPDGKFAKYFFYVFYPAHIWIIVLIKYLFF